MLSTQDNSFLEVYRQVFDHQTCSKLLDIERDIQRDPHIINYQRKAECLMMTFLFLGLHKQRIEHEQHWQREAAKARKERPEPRLDSRIIAEQLDIQHKNLLSTIERYTEQLKSFGTFAFETRKSAGVPTRYALLNENQCYFLATLSRNTAQVVAFKVWLVKTFSEYRTGARQEMPTMPMLT